MGALESDEQTAQPDVVHDVVVVGSGPAGLMCALWLARRGINVGILEINAERPARGRADGLELRSLEILDSFRLLGTWWRDANRTVELAVWVSNDGSELERIMRRGNSQKGSSRFPDATMDQAVVERAIEDKLREYGVEVQYDTVSSRLHYDAEEGRKGLYGVEIAAAQRGRSRKFRCKYLVGADGGRSWVRHQLGIEMDGARTAQSWGVIDVLPLTNFPDIRKRCIIHKKGCGTLMVIPRERGMIRLYVQLGEEVEPSVRKNPAMHTLAAARRILDPYQFDFKICHWSTIYEIQQRLATRFTDFDDHAFLLGDAVHTHSPKAGMGLNISLQEGYNLGWKLAAVVKGEAKDCLLQTFQHERRPIAEFLVDFDRNFQQFFHAPLRGKTIEDYRTELIEAVTVEHSSLSGTSAYYHDDLAEQDFGLNDTALATELAIGKRIPDADVINQADGNIWSIHNLLKSNGKWRLLVFPGDLKSISAAQEFFKLGKALQSASSPLHAYVSSDLGETSVIDVITVHYTPCEEIELLDLPEVFHPWNEERGWDYFKVFADSQLGEGIAQAESVYNQYGIGEEGCALLVRPDQHIFAIMQVANAAELSMRYLDRWLVKTRERVESKDARSTGVHRVPGAHETEEEVALAN